MPQLVLMRHAKAAPGRPDFARPLSEVGRRQAQAQGTAIARSLGRIDAVIVSDAARTLQTLAGMRSGGLEVGTVHELHELYTRSWEDLLDAVRSLDESVDSALVLGHEPTMSLASSMLAQEVPTDFGYGFSTAMAVIGSTGSWADFERGRWNISAVLRAPM